MPTRASYEAGSTNVPPVSSFEHTLWLAKKSNRSTSSIATAKSSLTTEPGDGKHATGEVTVTPTPLLATTW
ncbi:hypothetical protein OK016_27190 [Vibrio chagasii]|nr:hypothetical protein [Vibrio chagasii]